MVQARAYMEPCGQMQLSPSFIVRTGDCREVSKKG